MYKFKVVVLLNGRRPLISYGITADDADQAITIYKSCLIRDGINDEMLIKLDWMVFFGGVADA